MKLLYIPISLLNVLGYIIANEIPADRGEEWSEVDDMVLSKMQTQALYDPSNVGRNAESDITKRWSNATVPYEFASDFTEELKERILKVLEREFSKTCVTFRPRTPSDEDYVLVANGDACNSKVGRIGGMQKINLRIKGCIDDTTIAHEFLHTVGFFHQHSASNRDDYVTVVWANIDPGKKNSFKRYEANRVTDFGQPYDFNSILHYAEYAWSINNKPTLTAKKPNVKFGEASSLSEIDIIKVNKMYNCKMR